MSTRKAKRKSHIKTLKSYYPRCLHKSHAHNELYANDNTTYGEMEYDGIAALYTEVKKHANNIQTFIDVGSGYGKLNIFMSSYERIKQSIGIELVKERHLYAKRLLKKTKSEYMHKVEFYNDNILALNLSEIVKSRHPVFVWWSNLCFNQDKTDEIFDKLKAELPSKSIVACSKQVSNITPLKQMQVPMSWNSSSQVHLYRI